MANNEIITAYCPLCGKIRRTKNTADKIISLCKPCGKSIGRELHRAKHLQYKKIKKIKILKINECTLIKTDSTTRPIKCTKCKDYTICLNQVAKQTYWDNWRLSDEKIEKNI